MRDIIFRGKREYDGEWLYGNLVYKANFYGHNSGAYFIIPQEDYECETELIDEFKVIPETIGQYIGVLDQERRPIFEGDIISNFMFKEFHLQTEIIRFIDGAFRGCFHSDAVDIECCGIEKDAVATGQSSYIKIIGNVYDDAYMVSDKHE